MNKIREIIKEAITELIQEGRFDTTATPHNSHTDVGRNIGYNPLYSDNGGHAANDVVSQVSTFDRNGANFTSNGNDLCLSDNKFIIYKIKNFGNDKVKSTLSIFGNGAKGEKELRKAIDTVNGAATRNGRSVKWRTITSDSFKKLSDSSGKMSNTFWEFSYDNGNVWYILKPSPIQSMQVSKLVIRTNENKIRHITEAANNQFSTEYLSQIPSYRQRALYCRQNLGEPIGNGSSRTVFQIDDQRCLKLAKNGKGIAQNELEGEYYKQSFDCFPKIFDQDDNSSWIICEYVLPAKPNDFQHCLSISWDDFQRFIISTCYSYADNKTRQTLTMYEKMDDEEFANLLDTNEYLYEIYNYIVDYQAPYGDLIRISNYGITRRYNQDYIVILDHGLSEQIYNDYYKKRE